MMTQEQVYALIAAAISTGRYVVVNAVGVITFQREELAIDAFEQCARIYLQARGIEELAVADVTDPTGRTAVGFAVNTKDATYLYGVAPEKVALALGMTMGGVQ